MSMARLPTRQRKSAFQAAFRARLKQIREDAGFSQPGFAKSIGVSPGTYSKYESRSMLPLYLLPTVCEVTGHDAWFVLTGQPASAAPKDQNIHQVRSRR